MQYPEDVRSTALAYAFTALVKTLYDAGKLDPAAFLGNVAGAHKNLVDNNMTPGADALQDLIEPIAQMMGYQGRSDG